MISIHRKANCTGCSACSNICPRNCISMEPDEEGFLYPNINKEKCINCHLCDKVCPISNLLTEKIEKLPDAYLAWANDKEILNSATSGGVFTTVAKEIIQHGGVAVGAVYDDEFVVCHRVIKKQSDLEKATRSKYVQSRIGDIYSQVKELLESNRKVLFCGTACQIYGLKSFLNISKTSDQHLYTMDVVCHGTPSPKLLSEYISWNEKVNGSRVTKIMMREKNKKMRFFYDSTTKIEFENGKIYCEYASRDYYGRFFWGEISSRPSCYECLFKSIGRVSDITLGDCWFSRSLSGRKDVPFDVTLCMIHSEKGFKMLLNDDILSSVKVDTIKAIKCNGGMIYQSAKPHPRRNEFFDELGSQPTDVLAEKYFPLNPESKASPLAAIKSVIKLVPGVYKYYYFKKKEKEFQMRCKRDIPECAMVKKIL